MAPVRYLLCVPQGAKDPLDMSVRADGPIFVQLYLRALMMHGMRIANFKAALAGIAFAAWAMPGPSVAQSSYYEYS
jgi:hypothetical protein